MNESQLALIPLLIAEIELLTALIKALIELRK